MPGSDVVEAARHDAAAIAGNPAWLVLTRRRPPTVTPGWYRSYAPCDVAYDGLVVNCDEYPYASTAEGGPAAPAKPQASLRLLDKDGNQQEGRWLGGFFTRCGIENGDQFWVVPLVVDAPVPVNAVAPPTVGVCGS